MKQYQCRNTISAFKIKDVIHAPQGETTIISEDENDLPVSVNNGWATANSAKCGNYLVKESNGFMCIMRKDVFESNYDIVSEHSGDEPAQEESQPE